MAGTDLVMAVAEPTLSGIHDLKRVAQLTDHFGIQCSVIINKYDINPEMSDKIHLWCSQKKISLLGKVPYDSNFTKAQVKGRSLVEHTDNPTAYVIKQIWSKAMRLLTSSASARRKDKDERRSQVL
jgi:MinD superfamily P-loop ATPase